MKLVHNDENVNEMNDVNDVNVHVNCNSNQRTRMGQIHAQDAVRISTLDAGVVMKRLMVVVRDMRRGDTGRGDTGRGDTGRGTAGRGDTGCIVRSECKHANIGFRKQCHFSR